MLRKLNERLQFALFCSRHRLSRAAQERWQEKHLRRLVAHAAKNVPLWQGLLRERGVEAGDIASLADLPKLGATSKRTFIGRMVEEYIDGSRPVYSSWFVTSGTSGTPFRFLMKERSMLEKYTDFASFRFLWWKGEPFGKIATTNLAHIKIRAPNSEHRLFVPVEEYLRDPRSAAAQLVRFKTEILSTYPSLLLDMARHFKDPAFPRPKPRYILSFGEKLFPSTRRFIADSFGCEVYDRYGLEEIGVVGVECARHDGFHINTESVIVEITDDEYRPLPEGEEGRILVTDLFNLGMPFIRYDSGDRGRVSYEPCACGVRAPRLWLSGRYSSYLAFPERRIHHLEFDGAMDGFMHAILQYQIAKVSDSEILARVVPGPAFNDDVPRKVRKSLGALVGERVRVDVALVETLPRTPRGKSRIVIDESGPSPARA